jgi:hypothetical protein
MKTTSALRLRFMFMVFKATFNNISVISWQSVLLVEEIRVPRENHWPVARHRQTLSHNVRFEVTTLVVIGTDCIVSCKSNYHTIATTTASLVFRDIITLSAISVDKE